MAALQLKPALRGDSVGSEGRRSPTADQLFAAGGQLAAGAGNLLFTLLCARLLAPSEFAHLAAFLALYLLLHVVGGSVSAGTALQPSGASVALPRLWTSGGFIGIVLLVASPLVGRLLGIGTGLAIALAIAAPAAGALAAHRGRLYGSNGLVRVVASLAVEPAVRLTAGVALAVWAGPVGAGIAVALAGWAALGIAAHRRARAMRFRTFGYGPSDAPAGERTYPPAGTDAVVPRGTDAVLTFLLLAVVMNQDLLLTNRLLPDVEAARFAVLSTLGGLAAFATTTVPLVLLGQHERRSALRSALVTAAALGGAAVLVVIVAPGPLIAFAFGDRYAAVAPLVGRYVFAMAIFGVARVVAAYLCASGRGGAVWRTVALVALGQCALISTAAHTASGVATITLGATSTLAVALTVTAFVRRRPGSPSLREARDAARRATWRAAASGLASLRQSVRALRRSRTARIVAALTLFGLVVRAIVLRSLWLDEAIAVAQARLPFGTMLSALRHGDVHPPLHEVVLWFTIRVIGDGEIAVRLPSVIAGTLVVPLVFALAKELYDERTGTIAAALASVAPFLVWYSQEARMYAIFTLFAVAAALGQARAIRRGRASDWLLYAAATALLLWTQYFGFLQVVAQMAVFAIVSWKRRRSSSALRRFAAGWAGSIVAIGLVVLPLLPYLADQLDAYRGRSAALDDLPAQAGHGATGTGPGLTVYAALANIVWALWGYHSDVTMAQIVALWPLGMLFVLFLLGRGWSQGTGSLVAVIVFPMVALYALGLVKRDLFEIRYLAGIAPALIVLSARVISSSFRERTGRTLATAALAITMLGGLIDQQVNGANPRLYDFRGALGEVESIARPGDAVLYEPAYLQPVVSYYSPQLRAQRLGKTLPKPAEHDRVILLASFIDHKDIAAQAGWALSHLEERYALQKRIDRPRVRVWVFG